MPLLLVLVLLGHSRASHVALFPSTGCYSHDVMMREVGERLAPTANITWIQTFIYDFGFGEIQLPSSWNRLSLWGHDDEGMQLMRTAGSLLWEQNVPTDFGRPWDLRGTVSFFKMLERHQTYCEKMLDDERFLHFMRSQQADVVVLDHFLQECMGGLAFLLNSSVVQFSNWPIADGYITSLNVPANPSAVPKTGTPYTGLGMTFGQRVGNFLFHNVIVATRYVQIYVLERMFTRKGFPEVGIVRSEAERAIYAGRSEFLFDVVRPINNRVKHFGSIKEMRPRDYVTVLPEGVPRGHPSTASESSAIPDFTSVSIQSHKNSSTTIALTSTDCTFNCWKGRTPNRRARLYEGLSAGVVQKRFLRVSKQFPLLNWPSLVEKPFIVVSFGSVAQAHFMPKDMVERFIEAFSQSSHTIIWQTNSAFEQLLWTQNVTVPPNVILSDWVPLKEILAHPNLQYLICHGGINTINELLLFGVPVLGVYLQGDQGSNLQRLVDLGTAEVTSMVQISQGGLLPAMRRFERSLDRYWKRAGQLSEMLASFRDFHSERQDFWIEWSARNGKKLRTRRLLRMDYIGDTENTFWLSLLFMILILLTILR